MANNTSRHRRMLSRLLPLGAVVPIAVAILAGSTSRATDPTPPVEIDDSDETFEIRLVPHGVTAGEVSATLSFNRFAGAMVDRRESTVDAYPAPRQLEVRDNGDGTLSVDVSPVVPGQPPLPDGIFSQILELTVAPRDDIQFGDAQRHAIYFEVLRGKARRIGMLGYSASVEPSHMIRDKNGQLIEVIPGRVVPARSVLDEYGLSAKLESGDKFSTPGDESEEP